MPAPAIGVAALPLGAAVEIEAIVESRMTAPVRPPDRASRPARRAERASSRTRRSAFEAAIAAGYAIECDVQLSSDGVPFIFHDDDFERLTGATGRSDARPIAEVQKLVLRGSAEGEVPQRFTEFLAQVGGRTLLQIELKQQTDRGGDARSGARPWPRRCAAMRGPTRSNRSIRSCSWRCAARGVHGAARHHHLCLRRTGVGLARLGVAEVRAAPSAALAAGRASTSYRAATCRSTCRRCGFCRARGMPVTSWTIHRPSRRAQRPAPRRPDRIRGVFAGNWLKRSQRRSLDAVSEIDAAVWNGLVGCRRRRTPIPSSTMPSSSPSKNRARRRGAPAGRRAMSCCATARPSSG